MSPTMTDTHTRTGRSLLEQKVKERFEHDLRANRDVYVAGRQFRVLRPGARLEGILVFGSGLISGWSRPLLQGEVITCAGWRPGMIVEPGLTPQPEVNWDHRFLPANAQWCQVWPMAGLFLPWPMPGYLEPAPEGVRYG